MLGFPIKMPYKRKSSISSAKGRRKSTTSQVQRRKSTSTRRQSLPNSKSDRVRRRSSIRVAQQKKHAKSSSHASMKKKGSKTKTVPSVASRDAAAASNDSIGSYHGVKLRSAHEVHNLAANIQQSTKPTARSSGDRIGRRNTSSPRIRVTIDIESQDSTESIDAPLHRSHEKYDLRTQVLHEDREASHKTMHHPKAESKPRAIRPKQKKLPKDPRSENYARRMLHMGVSSKMPSKGSGMDLKKKRSSSAGPSRKKTSSRSSLGRRSSSSLRSTSIKSLPDGNKSRTSRAAGSKSAGGIMRQRSVSRSRSPTKSNSRGLRKGITDASKPKSASGQRKGSMGSSAKECLHASKVQIGRKRRASTSSGREQPASYNKRRRDSGYSLRSGTRKSYS